MSDEIDATVPHSARIWNYWLGGSDNYGIDRVVGESGRAIRPQTVAAEAGYRTGASLRR